MEETTTKDLLVQTGARLIHQQGYSSTGVQQILHYAGVPKGSFYFYFKNKKEFGFQVIDFFAGHFTHLQNEYLLDQGLPVRTRLKSFFDHFLTFFQEHDAQLGCPVGNLALELADVDEEFRLKLHGVYSGMINGIAALLEEGKERLEINSSAGSHELASFIVSSWEGALVAMKLTKNVEPLERFDHFLFKVMLKQGDQEKS